MSVAVRVIPCLDVDAGRVVKGVNFKDLRDAGPDALLSASIYAPVTKSDDDDLPDGICRALWVGTVGDANLVQPDGTERSGVPLVAGWNRLMVKRVKTGGSAGNIWALY